MISSGCLSTARSATRSANPTQLWRGGRERYVARRTGRLYRYPALFGLKYINPALTGSATGSIVDYHGVPLTGFNQLDFDPTPAQTLAVVETMLKKGIPVVYAYIADAHDNHEETTSSEGTFGPGEAPYVDQLADYNSAFGTFFLHLKEAGIDQSNTLFIFTPDEGDHFVGGAPSPANCDGAKIERNGNVVPDVPCTYGPNGVGELDINLAGLTAAAGDPTPYSIHFDDAAYDLRQRPAAAEQQQRPHAGADHGRLERGEPTHRAERELARHWLGAGPSGSDRGSGGHAALAHEHRGRSQPRTDVYVLRQSQFLFRVNRASTTPVVGTGLRLESRRHPTGNRAHLHRDRRSRGQESGCDQDERFLH